ncbi:MAG: CHAT domain-containing protein, partial [Bacteroidota bacterium]
YSEDVRALQTLRTQIAHAYRTGDPALSALTTEKERLERRLVAALPQGTVEDPWREQRLTGLQEALPKRSAFVDLYHHGFWEVGAFVEYRYSAVVVAPDTPPRLVDLGNASQLEEQLTAWRQAMLSGTFEADAARDFLAVLWSPIAEALPMGTEQLWVSPDAQLARLPWNWLAQKAARGKQEAGLTLAHIPSARALLRLLASASESANDMLAGTENVLVVGDVAFGSGSSNFAPLPATVQEAQALSELAETQQLDTTVLTGSQPDRATVLAALPSARYAHLATHGFFYGETEQEVAARTRSQEAGLRSSSDSRRTLPASVAMRNPLAESGIALAGANDGPEGTLTAEELVGLDLSDTRLVTLSACDTGRGREVTGQGVMGLRASLFAAGAETLLLSLWKVDDEATALLMEAFYRGLWSEGLAPAAALSQAQAVVRAYTDESGGRPYAAARYWAAWVLDGRAW